MHLQRQPCPRAQGCTPESRDSSRPRAAQGSYISAGDLVDWRRPERPLVGGAQVVPYGDTVKCTLTLELS